MSKKCGIIFERELSLSFKVYGFFSKKQVVPTVPGLKFAKKSPIDYLVGAYGNFYAIEAKSNLGFSSFPFKRLESDQRFELDLAKFHGIEPYIFINFRRNGNFKNNLTFCIKYEDFLDIEKEINRKSIPTNIFFEDKRFREIKKKEGKKNS